MGMEDEEFADIYEDKKEPKQEEDRNSKMPDEVEFETEDMPVNFNKSDPLNKGNKPFMYYKKQL